MLFISEFLGLVSNYLILDAYGTYAFSCCTGFRMTNNFQIPTFFQMELELAFAATQCNLIGNWINKLAPYYLPWVITNLAYKFIPMLMFKVNFLNYIYFLKPNPSTLRILLQELSKSLKDSWIFQEFSCGLLLRQNFDYFIFKK